MNGTLSNTARLDALTSDWDVMPTVCETCFGPVDSHSGCLGDCGMVGTADEAEWQALEAEHDAMLEDVSWRGIDTGCGKVGKPHPKSYGKDLPMRGMLHPNDQPDGKYFRYGLKTQTLIARMQWSTEKKLPAYRSPVTGKKVVAPKSKIRVDAPHPASYRPDLPMHSAIKTTAHTMPGKSDANGVWHFGTRVTRYNWPLTPAEKKTLQNRPLTYSHNQTGA